MKILTITSNDLGISWGPAIHFLELWNNAAEAYPELEIHGIAPSWTGERNIIPNTFPIKRVRVPNIKSWRQLYFDFIVALRLLRTAWRFDVIYVRLSHWHLAQIAVLAILRTRFVVELNGLAQEDSVSARKHGITQAFIRLQERWLIKHAYLAIAVSDGIAETVKKRYRPNCEVVAIQNGVASQFFLEQSDRTQIADKTVAIYVGTFTPWDGAEQVVRLAEQFPSVEFLMVGDGSNKARLERDSPRNVFYYGSVPYAELPALYQQAHCGIVLYEYERHKNVKLSSLKTLEYMASRLPVFTTAVPGQEIVESIGVGYLVKKDEYIVSAFNQFLDSIPKYYASYKNKTNSLEGQIGWGSTARKTIQLLSHV